MARTIKELEKDKSSGFANFKAKRNEAKNSVQPESLSKYDKLLEDENSGYSKFVRKRKLAKKEQALDSFVESEENVSFFEAMKPGGATPTDWRESRAKRKQLESEEQEAAAQVAAYEQFLKEKEFQDKTDQMTADDIDKLLSNYDSDIEAFENEKVGFFEAMKPGGVTPSERKQINKAMNSQIHAIESEQGKYRAVRDEKKSREMTENLPEDVIQLLDEYNSLGDISQGNDIASVIAPESSMMYHSDNYENSGRKQEIAQKLIDMGYSNYAELAEYRQYVKDIESNEQAEKEFSEFAKEHPVASSAMSVAFSPAASIAGTIGTVENAFSEKESDLGANPYDSWYFLDTYKNTTRETVPKTFEDGRISAKTKKFLYDTAMSGADSAIAGVTMGSVGAVLLGASAMNDTYVDVLKRGGTDEQALLSGVAAGVAEGFFEEFSLGRFVKDIDIKTIKDFAKNIIVESLVNASEETATEIANIATDYLVNGGLSDYYQTYEDYVAQGMTEEEAKKATRSDMTMQVFEAGASGALMGVAFSGYNSARNMAGYNSAMQGMGQDIVENNAVEKELAAASELGVSENDALYKFAQEVEEYQRKKSDNEAYEGTKKELRSIGKLSEGLDMRANEQIDGVTVSSIESRLTALGETSDVKAVAKAVYKKLSGEKLNSKERSVMKESKFANRVANELTQPGNTSSEWTEKMHSDVTDIVNKRKTPDIEAYRSGKTVKNAPESDSTDTKETTPYGFDNYEKQVKEKVINKGQDEEKFNAAFELFKEYGEAGRDFEEVKKTAPVTKEFTEAQMKAAYDLGKEKAEAQKMTVLKGIQKVESGEIYVTDTKGNVKKLSEVNTDDNTMNLYKSAAKYDTDTANVFIQGYNRSASVSRYTRAFDAFYSVGAASADTTFSEAMQKHGELTKYMADKDVAKKAFDKGRAERTKTDASIKQKKQTGKFPSKGTYQNKTVTIGEEAVDEFYTALVKKTGIDIERRQSLYAVSGQEANAQYEAEKNKMTVSASATREYQASIHELVHYAFAYNTEKMKPVKKAVIDYFLSQNSESELEELLRQYGASYEGDSRADIEEEFVGDAIGGMFSTEDGVNDFLNWLQEESGYKAEEKKTILQRITEWLNDIIEAIKDIMTSGKLNGAGKLFAKENCDELARIRKMFLEALDGAGENYREGGAVEGKVKNSINENFNKQIDSWDKNTIGFSFVVGKTSKALLEAGIPEQQIRWDASKLKKTIEQHTAMSIDVIKQVPSLLENPVVVIDSKSDVNSKIVMGELYDDNGKIVTAVLKLNPSSRSGNQLDLIKISSTQGRGHIESLFKYENGQSVAVRYVDKKRIRSWLNVNRLQLPLHSFNLDSNNSISDSSENVKNSLKQQDSKGRQLTREQSEFFKDSKIRVSEVDGWKNTITPNGALFPVYHGTNSDAFFEFDKSAIGSANDGGWYGKGFYFAFDEREAKYYGNRIMECYLNVKKPFFFSEEMQSFDGQDSGDVNFDFASFIINLSEKFPEIAKHTFVEVAEFNSAEVIDKPFTEFAKEIKEIYKNNRFKLTEVDDGGTKTYQYVYSRDIENIEASENTKKLIKEKFIDSSWSAEYYRDKGIITENEFNEILDLFEKYGESQFRDIWVPGRFTDTDYAKKNRLSSVITYIANKKYSYINQHLPEYYMEHYVGDALSQELRKKGYDGILQSRYGDEVVVFDSNQIKLVDNKTPTDNSDIRYSKKVDISNKRLTNSKGKRYNKRSTYSEFNSFGMQWSKNPGTKIGDTTYAFNSRTGKHCIIEATKNDVGFIVIEELSSAEWSVKYGRTKGIRNEGRSLHRNIDQFESTGRRGGYNSDSSQYRGEDGRTVQLSEEERIQSTTSGNLERSGENNQEVQDGEVKSSLKNSLDWVDWDEDKSLVKKVTELERINEDLRLQIRHPGQKHIINLLETQRVARELKSGYRSTVDREKLTTALYDFYTLIANGTELSQNVIDAHRDNIADMILNDSKYLHPDISEENKAILRDMRGVKIKLSDTQKAEVASQYGSYNEFRKKTMGTLILSNEGIDLDTRWKELCETYPQYFSEDIAEPDQPAAIMEIAYILRNKYEDDNGFDYDSAKDFLMTEIWEKYFEVPETKLLSQEYQAKLAKAKVEYRERLQEAKADYKKQTAEALRQARMEYGESLKNVRQEQAEQLLKAKARMNQRVLNIADTRLREKKRNRLIKTVKRLDRLLRKPGKGAPSAGTNKYGQEYVHLTNIPEGFKKAVIDFCYIFIENDAGVFTAKYKDSEGVVRKKVFELLKQYGALQESETYIGTAVNDDIKEKIEKAHEIVADKRLSQLTASELDTLNDIADHLITIINNEVEMWVNGEKKKVNEIGKAVLKEQNAKGMKGYIQAMKGIDKIGVMNLKPIYFFEKVGGTLQKLWNDILSGQDRYVRNMQYAQQRFSDIAKKYHLDSWIDDKAETFTTSQGHEISLTRGQALLVWATWKREGVAGKESKHLFEGGIVYPDAVTKASNKGKNKLPAVLQKVYQDGTAHRIREEDILEIDKWLTKEQKAYADELVAFLSNDVAGWGNEISMQLYGINKFNEKYYIPFNSAGNYLYKGMGEDGTKLLKSEGFTKETQWGANNPLVVDDFTEVVVKHIERMSMYNSMVIPLDNFSRVWNYQERADADSNDSQQNVKAAFETAWGEEYKKYVENLLRDINGGVMSDSREIGDKWISKFKKAAVMGSASVMIQQPSAIVRAFSEVNAKYFVATTFGQRKAAYEEAKQYAPVAVLKEIGGFDTVSGQSMTDWILKREYKGKDKLVALFKDSQFRDDVISWGPAWADRVTWAHIWLACKKEVAHTKGLRDEALLEATGERFTEVINKTQVYDCVLSRSDAMRSKSSLMKMSTAFMAEPTTQWNMYGSAVRDLKTKGQRAKGFAKIGSVIGAQALNSVLVSIIYAARDDDEDKTPFEKYVAEILGNFFDSLNPLTLVPFIKDIFSILQGYDIERNDMSVFADFADALVDCFNEDMSTGRKTVGIAGSVMNIFGIPLKNIVRDAEGVLNSIKGIPEISETTSGGMIAAIREELAAPFRNYIKTTKDEYLYDAWVKGQGSLYNEYASQYKTGSAIKTALTNQILERYEKGKYKDDAEATALLRKLGYSENEAEYELRGITEPVEEEEGEDKNADFFTYEGIEGVQAEADAERQGEREEAEEDDKEYSEDSDYTWLKQALKNGDKADIQEEINYLKNNGVTDSKINYAIKSWLKENDGSVKNLAESYAQGDLNGFESKVNAIASKYGVDAAMVAGAVRSSAGYDSKEIEGTVYAISDLHISIENSKGTQSKMIADAIIEAKTQQYIDEGKTRKEAENSARNSVKSSIRGKWKEIYQKSDPTTRAEIQRQISNTGVWKNNGDIFDMTREWRDEWQKEQNK